MIATIVKLHSWGGYAEPTRTLEGQIIAIHDIAEVWTHDGQGNFARRVLANEFDPELVERLIRESSELTAYDIFDELRAQQEMEMSSPFWGAEPRLPDGFQLISLSS